MDRERFADILFARRYFRVDTMYSCRDQYKVRLDLEEIGTQTTSRIFIPFSQFKQLGIQKDDIIRHSPWGFTSKVSIEDKN